MSVILATNTTGLSSSGSGVTLVLYSEHPFNAIPPSAGGDNSIALGSGAETTLDATNALAIGTHALARHPGSLVHSGGRFSSNGDMQSGRYLLRTHTINQFPTELFLDGTSGTDRLIIPDDSTWTFSITVTAHRQDVGDGHAGFKFDGVIYRRSGATTVAFQGMPVKSVIARSNSNWNINISANTTDGSLQIIATGETSKIIRWGALVETLEITN